MIIIDKLTHRYGKKEVLSNITLEISSGEITAILGHNGVGKTTLAKLIAGILRTKQIRITEIQEKRKIFYLFEESGLYQDFTIWENIKFKNYYYPDQSVDLDKLATHPLVEYFKLRKYLHVSYHQLSSGLKKRAQLLTGFLFQPEVILLDEPEQTIDPRTKELLTNKLIELQEEGKLILLITHDLELCYQCASRILILNDGKIVEDQRNPQTVDYPTFYKNYLEKTVEEN